MVTNIQPGDRVRLRSNPGRVGVFSGETIELRGGVRRLHVRFEDGEEDDLLEGALEKVEGETTSPYRLIRKGLYGRAADLRGTITYYRLSGRLANLIYSLNTTNTDFYPYQFKPVLNFLESPSQGLIVADEVGLGKTIEAGLIWTELRARTDARRLLVLCPAMLTEKWRDELEERFGVKAVICGAGEVLSQLQKTISNPHEPFVMIASIQGLRPPRDWDQEERSATTAALARLLQERELDDPLIDLLVIDEAHYLRNPETQSHRLGRLLRPVTESLVLLSATPIQMGSDDLFYLLNLLDEDSFPYSYSFKEILDANAPLVQLRDRILAGSINATEYIDVLRTAASSRIFEGNAQLAYLIGAPPDTSDLQKQEYRAAIADRLDRINPLTKVISRTRKRDVQERRVIRQTIALRASMNQVERSFYDGITKRVREFCERRDISTGFMLTIPQRQMSSSMPAACRCWLRKLNIENMVEMVYESVGDENLSEDNDVGQQKLGTLLTELVQIVREVGDYKALRANDTKFSRLLEQLRQYWDEYPEKKVILFSYFRDTLYYLNERLVEVGVQCAVLHGGIDKHEVIRNFAMPTGPMILLSSEVAAEGVDLQFSSLLINYDLPWNPMKIEQRIGRIDRIGQRADRITIWNLLYEETIDDRVYDRLLMRLDVFEAALGTTEAVLGREIWRMSYELLRHQLTPEQEMQRIDQTAQALANNRQTENRLEEEASHLIAHSDYIQNHVKAAVELGRYITGQDLHRYMRDFMEKEYEGSKFVQVATTGLLYEIELSTSARADISNYLSAQRSGPWTSLTSGSTRTRYRFENRVGTNSPGIEVISQYHPVIRFISHVLRKKGKGAGYHPIAAASLATGKVSGVAAGIYAYAVMRWTVEGVKDMERLEYFAKPVGQGSTLDSGMSEKLVNMAAAEGADWLGAENSVDCEQVAEVYEKCVRQLEMNFDQYIQDLQRENHDRINFMIKALERHRAAQNSKYQAIVDHHREVGRTKLIPAVKGTIQKLNNKIEQRIFSLRQKENINSSNARVSGGLIRVIDGV